MQYNHLNKLNIDVSKLGYGCMRFPTDTLGNIVQEKALKLIDQAYQNGVTYFDTAYVYNDGQSEKVTGLALSRYPRDSYYLATKLPLWGLKSIDQAREILEEELKRLKTDHIDFYLMHNIDDTSMSIVETLHLIDYFKELKKEGKIKYIGFSSHATYSNFIKILHWYDWDFCQLQINYFDRFGTFHQGGIKGAIEAEKLGIPVIVMEPVKGGSLSNLNEKDLSILQKIHPSWTASSWALRFASNVQGVKVVLSGMSHLDQVNDNLKTFQEIEPTSEEELKAYNKVRKNILSSIHNTCTGCKYCSVCPQHIEIDRLFRIWNEYAMFHDVEATKKKIQAVKQNGNYVDKCLKCGLCESRCPQHLSIRDNLQELQKEFEELLNN